MNENLDDDDDVYLVASFNFWYPNKMQKKEKKKVRVKDDQYIRTQQFKHSLERFKNVPKEVEKKLTKPRNSLIDQYANKTIDEGDDVKYSSG